MTYISRLVGSQPAVNAEEIRLIVKEFEANPNMWDQAHWAGSFEHWIDGPACGTTGCLAGWAVMRAGYEVAGGFAYSEGHAVGTVPGVAQRLLGLSDDQAVAVFSGNAGWIPDGDRRPRGYNLGCFKELITTVTGVTFE
jgi:hypothetical protein